MVTLPPHLSPVSSSCLPQHRHEAAIRKQSVVMVCMVGLGQRGGRSRREGGNLLLRFVLNTYDLFNVQRPVIYLSAHTTLPVMTHNICNPLLVTAYHSTRSSETAERRSDGRSTRGPFFFTMTHTVTPRLLDSLTPPRSPLQV